MSGTAPGAAAADLRVSGGASGVAAQLLELDDLVAALVAAAADCAAVVARTVQAAVVPALVPGLLVGGGVDPAAAARLVTATADVVSGLCRAGSRLASLAASVAAVVAAYRLQESAVESLLRGVPMVVGSQLRATAGVAVALASTAPLVSGPVLGTLGVVVSSAAVTFASPSSRDRVVGAMVDRPWLVDAAVRTLPGVVGLPSVRATARAVKALGTATGLLVETPVQLRAVGTEPTRCGPGPESRPATGVSDLLRRGETVAAWREPAAGAHDPLGPGSEDPLEPGQARPSKGQIRVDEVRGPVGEVAWVVHVPGTQEWDGDGRGSPMDMAGNVALVAGADTAVASGVAAAMVRAGVRPGQPVVVVGHSQGGMTALDVAADPRVRAVATITHVITAGSPVAGRTPPPGVQVLALEHDDDLVPRLDGRDHPDEPDVVTVRGGAPDGTWRTDAVPAHSSSAYVATAAQVDSSTHGSLVAYREGLAPFLDREGASCQAHEVVLERDPERSGSGRDPELSESGRLGVPGGR